MDFKIYNSINLPTDEVRENIVNFLYTHLERFRDSKKHISKAIAYSLKETSKSGGFVLTAWDKDEIIGAVVINRTGMDGYIPENILVYIAVHKDSRGKGYGKILMKKAIDLADGAIALHVEPDNPAKLLYEKLGFENKYLEMRRNS